MRFLLVLGLSIITAAPAMASPASVAPTPSTTKYCVYRASYDSTVGYVTTKLTCNIDEPTVEQYYTGLRLSIPNTSIVMTAPGGAIMYAKPST